MSDLFDFELNFNFDRPIRILQLTDFQPIDVSQQRFVGRLDESRPIRPFGEEDRKIILYNEIEYLINKTKPDLILITGDYVYGEFDDNGKNLIAISNFINKFNIPWSVIFGNHDNESKMGVTWQCHTLSSYSNCLFKRGNLTGNSNFNIAIKQNGELIKVIYMIDSNGCSQAYKYYYKEDYPLYNKDEKVELRQGIFEDQIEYIDKSSSNIDEKYGEINKIICSHIAPDIIDLYCFKNGYQSTNDVRNKDKFILGVTCPAKNGDFGEKGENNVGFESSKLWPILKKNNFTHMFVGHNHINNFSILCDDIRVTFGVKTGSADYHNKTGGTLITLVNKKDVQIEHIFVNK